VLVELHEFGSEGMDNGQVLRAPNARVVIGPADLCQRHLRDVEDSTISLYHLGWSRLANSTKTSPRTAEPKVAM
jgi:hypothetical protein